MIYGNSRRAFVLVLTLFVAAVLQAQTAVYPTGSYPTDVYAVQAAIDGGGTVLLKATDMGGNPTNFNFGPAEPGSGFVYQSSPDVTLVGETVNGHMSTISGGSLPVRVTYSGGRFTLRGIHLDKPQRYGVFVFATNNTEISNNVITNVIGGLSGGFTFARAITASGDQVTGDLLIANNVVAGVEAQVGYGIVVAFTQAATTISGNQVSGTNFNGILVGGIVQPTVVSGNTVVPGPPQDPEVTAGNGILFGHSRGGSVIITGNHVQCDNHFADGIAIVGGGVSPEPANNSVVEKNDVAMHGSYFGGISLYDHVANNLVRANTIRGDGAAALQVASYISGEVADSNSFVGNNISRFASTLADVFLDENSTNTIFKGMNGTVLDLGTDNWVSGFSKKSPDQVLGSRMKQEQTVRRLALSIDPDPAQF